MSSLKRLALHNESGKHLLSLKCTQACTHTVSAVYSLGAYVFSNRNCVCVCVCTYMCARRAWHCEVSEDTCCVGCARGMDAISLPALHLALLFVEWKNKKHSVSWSPTPSVLHHSLLFHHRKAMLWWPQRTPVWADRKYLSVHSGVTYSSPIVSLNRLEFKQLNRAGTGSCVHESTGTDAVHLSDLSLCVCIGRGAH